MEETTKSYGLAAYLAAEAISSVLHWSGIDEPSMYPPRHCKLSHYAAGGPSMFVSVLIVLQEIIAESDAKIGATYADGRMRLRRARKILALAVKEFSGLNL